MLAPAQFPVPYVPILIVAKCWACRRSTERFVPKAKPIIAIVHGNDSVRDAIGSLVRSLGYSALKFASADEFINSRQVSNTSCLITDVTHVATSVNRPRSPFPDHFSHGSSRRHCAGTRYYARGRSTRVESALRTRIAWSGAYSSSATMRCT
jgi:hypothetical protein